MSPWRIICRPGGREDLDVGNAAGYSFAIRRGLLTALLVSIALATVGVAAAVSSGARTSHTITERFTLPAPGQARMWELTLKESPRKHLVSPRLIDANDPKLPPGVRAVAALRSARTKHGGETFKVFIAINNPSSSGARVAYDQVMLVDIGNGSIFGNIQTPIDFRNDCPVAVGLGNRVDDSAEQKTGGSWTYFPYDFVRLREMSIQPSPDEEVFDFTIYRMCAHYKGVELPDAGNT